jgi:hypothetical protein
MLDGLLNTDARNQVWPSPIAFFCLLLNRKPGCTHRWFHFDDDLCTTKEGASFMCTDADIIADDIQVYLGKTQVDVEYDLGGWEVIKVLSNEWEVLIEDNNFGYGPLAIRKAYNATTKSVKTQAERGWITICHILPEIQQSYLNYISSNAWPVSGHCD